MKWLLVFTLFGALMVSGCATKKHGSDDPDVVAQADTAPIDSGAGLDELPVADESSAVPTSEESTASNNNEVPPVAEPEVESVAPSTTASAPEANPTQESTSSETPPSSSGSGELATYTVQRGDTLMKIAFNLYGDINQWKLIYEQNRDVLKGATTLAVGKRLKYEKPSVDPSIEHSGDPYLIKQGDTLGAIADDIYAKRSKWKKLYENNRTLIRDPNRIYAGFYLYYQITEQEKKQAQEIKARREQGQEPQKVGEVKAAPSNRAPAGVSQAPHSIAQPAQNMHPASNPQLDDESVNGQKGGALDALAAPSGNTGR